MTVPGADQAKEPNKLILCFDGTGNTFSGSNADTNVVKILNKLDRHHPKQYHYYQTGVGTYDINEKSVNKTWIGELRSSLSKTVDQAVGTTFDSHVMAGYRFLMRYYQPGDKIYMFGFSRGAFTAKFLARMVHTVGLLCMGNEEMVPFAYRLYQRYLAGEVEDFKYARTDEPSGGGETEPLLNGSGGGPPDPDGQQQQQQHGDTYEAARNEMLAFSSTFCRKEPLDCNGQMLEENVKVYFLGLWDCVNSVAVLEKSSPLPMPVKGNAHFVRHAVAVDERRVKFKPALLAQDVRCSTQSAEDIKEVWFPGGHGDVGGGWPAGDNDNLEDEGSIGYWQRARSFWTTLRAGGATRDVRRDAFQMSDVPLSWMIRELELVGAVDPEAAVKWSNNVNGYKRAFGRETSQKQALKGFIHDSLRFGTGTGFTTVLLWRLMEFLPTITRWELDGNTWRNIRFPLNKGSCRDIPPDAVLHESLVYRLRNVQSYRPGNNHGGSLPPCLKRNEQLPEFQPYAKESGEFDPEGHHRTYVFKAPDVVPARGGGSCAVM